MRKNLTAAITLVAAAAALTACSPANNNDTPTSTPSQSPAATESTTPTAATTGALKKSCEDFNTLIADYRNATSTQDKAKLIPQAMAVRDEAPQELQGLFNSLETLMLEQAAAGQGGAASQATKDAFRDAAFGAAVSCTAAGVTLKL